MGTFKIGINMAGAISAGAYTAGVLDFLIQALDEWYMAKARGDDVPMHDISIEVMSGASAGGMCAAIGCVALQEDFPHVTTVVPTGDISANKLYSSWVEKIDISSLLKTEDLKNNAAPVSILDSTVLPQIAAYALTPGARRARKYVSDTLTLFLTLTNLRGTVYDLAPANDGSFEEQIAYFADQLQFQVVPNASVAPVDTCAEALPLDTGSAGSPGWQLLQTAALATGAFPVALAPRKLQRDATDYVNRKWVVSNPNPGPPGCECETTVTIQPDFAGPVPADPITTVNVDGGATNNSPFELSRRYLADLKPKPASGHNNRQAETADRAVITIAPFPGQESFDAKYDADKQAQLLPAIGSLIKALISQSRFLGESLSIFKENQGFSRFVIAPSDDQAKDKQSALMSGALGAFGGFLAKQFRQRDYQLGRRNCQWFLQQYFVLKATNLIIEDGLARNRTGLITRFRPTKRPDLSGDYVPIIPLCGSAAISIDNPGRPKVPASRIKDISSQAADRLVTVLKAVLQKHRFLSWLVSVISFFGVKGKIRDSIQDYVMNDLKDAVDPKS
jgi:hypothetical protein